MQVTKAETSIAKLLTFGWPSVISKVKVKLFGFVTGLRLGRATEIHVTFA